MKRKHFLLLTMLGLIVGSAFFSACEKVPAVKLTVDETMLVGKWSAQDNPQEFWRYDKDHTGETWDQSEDVQEGEGTHYNWSVTEDQLQIDLYGEMGQHVYKDYTVTYQTRDSLVWKDLYGNSRSFTRSEI